MNTELPQGLKLEENIAYGMRTPGVLEIKFHNPKAKNSFSGIAQQLMGRLYKQASEDNNVKVVLIYGSEKIFSAGNDLKTLAKGVLDRDNLQGRVDLATKEMTQWFINMLECKKPIVAVVRGKCVGVAFTQLNFADFVYVTEDATFIAPFMATAQSPEGSSSLNFTKILGPRKAAQVLLLDQPLLAQEAVKYGFATDMIKLQSGDFIDPKDIPCIPGLLRADFNTLTNCVNLLRQARDKNEQLAALQREAAALGRIWMDEEFPGKMMNYMKSMSKKAKNKPKAKL